MHVADTNEKEVVHDPRDKFAALQSLLVAYRNRNRHKLQRLLKSLPSVHLDPDTFTPQGEQLILTELEASHRDKLQEDIKKHQKNLAKRNEDVTATNTAKSMRRLKPPGSKANISFQCMFNPANNEICTSPQEIIDLINAHWRQTFEREFTPDHQAMEAWLEDFPRRFGQCSLEDWVPTVEDVNVAIMLNETHGRVQ